MIDGPFSSASGDILKTSHPIIICNSIGITPFLSILEYVTEEIKEESDYLLTNKLVTSKIDFILVVRSMDEWMT